MKIDVTGKKLKIGQSVAVSTKLKGGCVIRVGEMVELGPCWLKIKILGRIHKYPTWIAQSKIERLLILNK